MDTIGTGPRSVLHASGPGGEDVEREVRRIIAERCGMSVDAVTTGLSLENGLGVDSLALIEINVALEERFDIVGPDFAETGELDLRTVGELVAFVEAKVAARRGAR